MPYLYLSPWVWNTAGGGYWDSPFPDLRVGCLDLRPPSVQGRRGGTPSGVGLFVYQEQVSKPGMVYLGDNVGKLVSTGDADTFQSLLKLADKPEGKTLVDLLWNVFTIYADPTGTDRPRPLMPTVENRLELHLGGFSPIKTRPTYACNKEMEVVRKALHYQYKKARRASLGWPLVGRYTIPVLGRRLGSPRNRDRSHYLKLLGGMMVKYGIKPTDLDVVLWDMRNEGWLPPSTTLSENFDTADSDTLGGQLTWTEVVIDIDIASNKAQQGDATANSAGRAESDLSSVDHFVQADIEALVANTPVTYLLGRFAGAATTYYRGGYRDNAVNTYIIGKVVTGTATNLFLASATAPGDGPLTTKFTIDGSSLTLNVSGSDVLGPSTDTAITDGTRCGIGSNSSNVARSKWNNWSAEDLVEAPAAATPAGVSLARRWRRV